MAMTTSEALAKIDAMLGEITPGPWKADDCGDVFTLAATETLEEAGLDIYKRIGTTSFHSVENKDARFIASAPRLIRALVDVTKAAKEYQCGVEAQDMGFRLPVSTPKPFNPGSYADLNDRLNQALAALTAAVEETK